MNIEYTILVKQDIPLPALKQRHLFKTTASGFEHDRTLQMEKTSKVHDNLQIYK